MTDRIDRVDELVRREISVIILEYVDDPLVRSITITKVDVSRDLSLARISYLTSASPEEKEAVARGLKKAAGFIRGKLAKVIKLKTMPRLSFSEDRSEEREEEIERLFKLIEKEHAEEKDPNEERPKDEQ